VAIISHEYFEREQVMSEERIASVAKTLTSLQLGLLVSCQGSHLVTAVIELLWRYLSDDGVIRGGDFVGDFVAGLEGQWRA